MKPHKDQTIVILQDRQTIWSRWQKDQLIDKRIIPHAEQIHDAEVIPFDGITGVTLRFKRPTVNLIVDSSLDDVDAMTRSVVRPAVWSQSPNPMHIHESLNSRSQLWLRTIQKQGVEFDDVTSSLRLLQRHFGSDKRSKLIIVDDDKLARHVLCRSGHVDYARQCVGDNTRSSQAALAETLDYLSEKIPTSSMGDCEIVYVGNDQACLELLKGHSEKPVNSISSSSSADWYFTLFRQRRRHADNGILNRVLNGQLNRSESRRRLRHNDQRLYIATCLTVFVASVTVIVACVHGFTVARYMRSLEARSDILSDDIGLTKQMALAIDPSPIHTAETLGRLELFDTIESFNLLEVLGMVADAVSRHPDIELERLEWAMTDTDEALQSISISALESAPVPIAIKRILDQSLDAELSGQNVAGTQIAIDGSIQHASLRKRQTIFENFINTLEATPNIVSVQVMSSPLEGVSTSEKRGIEFQFSVQIFHWPS